MTSPGSKHIREKWNIESGEFFTQELPTIIMSSAIFVGIQKLAETILGIDGAAVIFYEAGKKVGISRTRSWQESWELDGLAFIKEMEEYLAELGWGRISVDLDALVIKAENSFIAKNYGKSEVPVCHFLRGYYAGMGEVLTHRAMDAEEVKCIACGDELCEFVLKPIE
ncbi:MAG: V4R domain-containing protein [Candidatus Methanospirareceae archaeon]